MIPAGWVSTTTGDLIAGGKLEVGDGYRAKNAEFGPAGVPFLRIRNLAEGRLELGGADLFPEENLVRVGPKVSRPGDCVIATKATIGRMAYLDESAPRVLYSPQVSYWRVLDSAALDSRFIGCWLRGREFETQAFQTKSSTSMADYINLRDQRQMRVTLPPIDQQRKIAATLAAYDELIENNLRRIEVLETMAQVVYREWFVKFRFPGHEDVPLVDSPLGTIPDGWAVHRSLELCEQGVLEIGDGYRAKNAEMASDGRYAFLRVKNVREGYLDLDDVDRLPSSYGPKLGAKVARPGDTAISMKGSVGRTAWVDSRTPPIVYSPQVSYWRSLDHSRLPSEFIRLWVMSDSFTQQCASAKGSTAMADYVNLADQRSMLLTVPSRTVLDAFVSLASPMLRLAQSLRAQNENLRSTRDFLLPKLVSGDIDVSDLDIETEWLAS